MTEFSMPGSSNGAKPADPDPSAKPNPAKAPDEAPRSRLDTDVQRLVEAVSNLAEAGARPIASALRVLGDSLGTPTAVPRVRLHNLEQVSTELVSAAVRFAEGVANISLQALGVTPPASKPAGAAPALPSAAPGETLRLPMSVENPTAAAMRDLHFIASDLTRSDGATIAAASVRVEPERLEIAPHDFEKLVTHVQIPADAAAGVYSGQLVLAGQPNFVVPLRVRVA